MTDRAGWGKVKCYFCCKNLVSQSEIITQLVTLLSIALHMMICSLSPQITHGEKINDLDTSCVQGLRCAAIDHLQRTNSVRYKDIFVKAQ